MIYYRLILTTILLFIISNGYSQNEEMVKYQRDFIAFEGCEKAVNLKKCFEKKFQDFIITSIKRNDIETLIEFSKKDTITFYSNLFFSNKGKLVKGKSYLHSEYQEKKLIPLQYILKKLPNIKPPLDEFNNIVSIAIDNIFAFKINRITKTLSPIYNFEPTEIPFNIIDKVPTYDGCDENSSNDDLKACISNKVSDLFSNNFDLNVLYDSKLPNGLIRIYLQFKVDKNGDIKNIKTNMNNRNVKKETIRIIELIPKFKKPGIHKGKPVIVPFSLPIIFSLER